MISKTLVFAVMMSCVFGLELIPCTKTKAPVPVSLDIAGCDNFPCPMYKGEKAKCNVTFVVPDDTDSIKTTIKAKVGFITTSYPLPDPEVCHFLSNAKCPLKAGQQVSYSLEVEIKKYFPSVSFTMEATLTDQKTKKPIACFSMPGKVKSRSSRRSYRNH